MRLESVTLENFRGYSQPTTIRIGDITALMGRNDAGKSSIFDALNAFFSGKGLDRGDIPTTSANHEIRITCEFSNFPALVNLDSGNQTTLAAEHLLNPDGNLEIIKVFSGAKMTCSKVLARAVHPTATGGENLLTLKITDLRKRAAELGVALTSVNQTVKAELRQAIWAHLGNLSPALSEIELKTEDTKYIWDDLGNALPHFALFKSDRKSTDQDEEAQDPMNLAIRQAMDAMRTDIDRIKAHVTAEVEGIARLTVEKLRDIDPSLAAGLNPKLEDKGWEKQLKVNLADESEVPVNKRGSGFRRLLLISFFRAQVERQAEGRNVIIAFEEPETSQHPKNQKLLMEAFQALADDPMYQILLTTHTPTLARLLPLNSIRYISCDASGCRLIQDNDESTYLQAVQELGVLPDHDVTLFLGIEGPNDEAFWRNASRLLSISGHNVPNLGYLADIGKVVFMPLGGGNLQYWVSRLARLNIPEVYLFDRDAAPGDPPKYAREAAQFNARQDCKAFITSRREAENYIHPDAINDEYGFAIQVDGICDVPNLVAKSQHDVHNPGTPWNTLHPDDQRYKESKAKKRLNGAVLQRMTATQLLQMDPDGYILSVLDCIKEVIAGNRAVLN